MSRYTDLCSTDCLYDAWKTLQKRPQSFGLDKVTIRDFRAELDTNLAALAKALTDNKYGPVKLLPHLLKKPDNNYRLLRIPAVKDRVVQKAVVNLISKPLDKKYGIENNGVSFAYVSGGSVEKAAIQIRKYWEEGYIYVYKADIEKFFDNIRKDILLDKLKAALKPDLSLIPLIETFLNTDVENIQQIVNKAPHLFNPDPLLGIAQGSPLSPLFANVYLAEFDSKVKKLGYKMVRYADDLVIMTKSLEDAEGAHEVVKDELKKLGLTVHALKQRGQLPVVGQSKPKYSEATRYQDLQFLGLTFKSAKIYPTGRSYQNAIKSVRTAAYDRSQTLVRKLAAVEARVTGWCSAYGFADHEFDKLDHNDKLLDDVLLRMLKYHGLKVVKGKQPHTALGLNNYTQAISKIKAKKGKEDKAKK